MELVLEILFWLSLAAVLYSYIGYPFLLLLCNCFVRRTASQLDEQYRPTVSMVLAAYNEEDCIAAKLDNCLALDYPGEKLQILVGSDGSDDRTCEIAVAYESRGVELHDFQQRRGKMATVNRLVAEASGEICVFSDISELYDHDAILKLVRHFADPSIGAVTGNHVYDAEKTGMGMGTRFYWKFQRFCQRMESRLLTICMCDGTIYAVRRSSYPPPPDNTINDDVAVPLGIIRGGRRVVFESEAVARGKVLSQTQHFFRQKIRSQSGKYQNFFQFPRMLLPWHFRRFWIYISHSVMPVLCAWFLILTLVTNTLLAFSSVPLLPLYQVLLILQGIFYGLALLGFVANRFKWYLPGTAIPFYFVTANIGSLCGFFAYLFGAQSAAWRKVE
ncbi:MAG: glycosyltransferase family 2 protein [Planctomycetales bacterium]